MLEPINPSVDEQLFRDYYHEIIRAVTRRARRTSLPHALVEDIVHDAGVDAILDCARRPDILATPPRSVLRLLVVAAVCNLRDAQRRYRRRELPLVALERIPEPVLDAQTTLRYLPPAMAEDLGRCNGLADLVGPLATLTARQRHALAIYHGFGRPISHNRAQAVAQASGISVRCAERRVQAAHRKLRLALQAGSPSG